MINVTRLQRRLAARGFTVAVDGALGPGTYAALLAAVGQTDRTPLVIALGRACAAHFELADIATPLRLAHNLAQACVETGRFGSLVENLNYSVDGLLARFGRHRISDADARRLGRAPGRPAQQEAIANVLYGGAWGRENLGNTEPGDGWRYRGRGWKQTTGRANYAAVERETGLPVLAQPELLEQPDTGVRAGCLFWEARGCNLLADRDDLAALTRRVNGGANGLAARSAALSRAKALLL